MSSQKADNEEEELLQYLRIRRIPLLPARQVKIPSHPWAFPTHFWQQETPMDTTIPTGSFMANYLAYALLPSPGEQIGVLVDPLSIQVPPQRYVNHPYLLGADIWSDYRKGIPAPTNPYAPYTAQWSPQDMEGLIQSQMAQR